MIRVLFSLLRRFSGRSSSVMLLKVAIAVAALIAFSASGFLYFEMVAKPDLTWTDAIWWAVVTMTTVGYGDYFPTTLGGRYLIGVPTMVFGISILGYLLSTVASYFIEARSKELKGMASLTLKEHILVVHYPSLARVERLLAELRNDPKTAHCPVVLIADNMDELPEALDRAGVKFVKGSATAEDTLERACLKEATYALILAADPMAATSDYENLAVVLTLERLHAKVHTVAEVVDPAAIALLKRAGCDSVVCLASLTANFLAQELLDPGVQSVLEEITNNGYGQQIYFTEFVAAHASSFETIAATLRQQGAMALGIERGAAVTLNPPPEHPVEPSDRIICLGAKRPAAVRL